MRTGKLTKLPPEKSGEWLAMMEEAWRETGTLIAEYAKAAEDVHDLVRIRRAKLANYVIRVMTDAYTSKFKLDNSHRGKITQESYNAAWARSTTKKVNNIAKHHRPKVSHTAMAEWLKANPQK